MSLVHNDFNKWGVLGSWTDQLYAVANAGSSLLLWLAPSRRIFCLFLIVSGWEKVRISSRKYCLLTCGLRARTGLQWHRQYSPPLLVLSHSLHHCTSCRHQTRKLSARTWPNSRPTSILCLMQCKRFLLHRQAQNDFKSYTLATSKPASLQGSTVNILWAFILGSEIQKFVGFDCPRKSTSLL